ncbi:MAG TPA: hypothetical protein VFS09_03905 [Candidatus Eisenbacteria bacterium]|nr:hypothetical protein [Candidatus Eisenbacteria bacterium]
MTRAQVLKRLKRSHWQALERHLKIAYAEGVEAGLARARGGGRRARTIRGDATVEGLVRLVTRHFGLDRYKFEVRVVHPESGRRIPARDLLRDHLAEPERR